jgi:hypothetical protein
VKEVFGGLPRGLKKLDATASKVGGKELTVLYDWMREWYFLKLWSLKVLILKNNKLKDDTLAGFFKNVKSISIKLEEIDLSQNYVDELTIQELCDVIEVTQTLKKINLGWNYIKPRSGIQLFEAIGSMDSVVDVDLSYNLLGKCKSNAWVEMIAKIVNKGFINHLNLSYNSIKLSHCELFGQLIEHNHTLFGLHMQGNDCYLDANGFVRIDKSESNDEYSKYSFLSVSTPSIKSPLNFIQWSTWWICEGWSETTFIVKKNRSIFNLVEPVQIHFSFNTFQPELMTK